MAFTTVASGTASVTLLAANSARKSVIIANTDANILRVLLADGTASSTNFSYAVPAISGSTPGQIELPNYKGKIVGVWDGDGSGSAMVTYW